MSDSLAVHPVTPTLARTTDVAAKGAGMRAVGYPLVSFTVPVLGWTLCCTARSDSSRRISPAGNVSM